MTVILLATFVTICVLLALVSSSPAAAAPFQSPVTENTIHQPLIAQNGEIPTQFAILESKGAPMMGVVGFLLLLFIPALSFASTRRHR